MLAGALQPIARPDLLSLACLLLITGVACRGDRRPVASAPVAAAFPQGRPHFVDQRTGQSLAAAETELDFGRVRLRESARRELRIRNDGHATSTVTAVQSAPEDFPREAFSFSSVPIGIGPGGEAAFAITFQPTQARDVSGSLALLVANGDPSTLLVRVRGTGYRGDSPDLEIHPQPLEQLDFGDSPGTLYITLTNVGADIPGTTADNLRLGVVGPDGEWDERVPAIAGPDESAFSLAWPAPGYGPDGLAEGEKATLAVQFLPSCQGLKSATLVIASNDPHRPEVRVPMSGFGDPTKLCSVEVLPSQLDFGAVDPGRYLTLDVSIVNNDQRSPPRAREIALLDLSEDAKATGAFALVNGPISNASIAFGETLHVPVRFAPTVLGEYTGDVVVRTSGSSASEGTLSLAGHCAETCLMVAPRELDFGPIGLGCNSRQRLFTMYNLCSPRLTVSAIDMLPGPTSDRFSITKSPHLPVVIAGGAQSDFGVTFRSAQAGDDYGTVALRLDGEPVSVIVPLFGHAAAIPIQTDSVGGMHEAKFDLLFVVDNSPAMARFQSALTANFTSFIRSQTLKHTDYHIAVTTTDVSATGEAGRFVPLTGASPRVLTPSTPDLESQFLENLAVGASGSSHPSLLRPLYLALSSPLRDGHNAGFLRDDAMLAIVVVSASADEDPFATQVGFYERFLIDLKGISRRNAVGLFGVIPLQDPAPDYSSGCVYADPSAGQDPRAKQLIQRIGGREDDICNPNWWRTLVGIFPMTYPRTTYFLSSTPDMSITPDPIRVTIDGTPYPRYGSRGDKRWEYNPASNAVEFDPWTAPNPTSDIEITYQTECL